MAEAGPYQLIAAVRSVRQACDYRDARRLSLSKSATVLVKFHTINLLMLCTPML
jgi:hypothetical protein